PQSKLTVSEDVMKNRIRKSLTLTVKDPCPHLVISYSDDLFADLNVKTAKPSHGSRIMSKNNKVSLEELGINSDRSVIIPANNESSNFSLLNSPPSSAKLKVESMELELKRMENELKQIVDVQLVVFQKRNKIHGQLVELWKTLKTLETDQANALTNEDYVQADKLTHDIQELNNKIKTFCGVLPGIEQTLNELREKQVKYLKSQSETNKTLEKELVKKKKKEEDAHKQYAVDMENLHIWNKGVADLNERIEERVRDEKLERESLLKKRENVQTQIAELLQRLEKLRAEEKSYTRQITDIDLQIESIANEFNAERDENSREKIELDRRKQEVDNKTRHVEETETHLHQRLEHYRKRQETSQVQLESLEQRISEIRLMAKSYREEAIEVEKLIEHLKHRSQRDNDCEKEIFDIRLQMEESDTEVKRLTSKVMHDQQTYSNIKQDISTIDTQIPALEEQKKLAVAGRDFKSAGRLANRIKDLLSIRDERTKFLETKRESLERDQERLKASRKTLEDNTTKLAEAVKKIGAELEEELQESLLQLRSRYDVANQQKLNFLQSLLQNEIQGMECRINHVRMKYGINDERGSLK
ncbi:21912_t:CDS:10, partial [Racocetra persica]